MCHHAAQFTAAAGERAADFEQGRVVGHDAGAVAVAIDFDHHRNAVGAGARVRGNGARGVEVVEDESELRAALAQVVMCPVVWRHADGIEDVVDAWARNTPPP